MSAIELLTAMKADRNCILWLNHERRDAAYHPSNGEAALPVSYNDAALVRSDPGIAIIEKRDGEILQAA